MVRTDLQAKVTKTAAFTGTTQVDISGMTGDWTIVLEVLAMNDDNTCRFVIEDTEDNFSAVLPGPTKSVYGKLHADSEKKRFTWKHYDFPSLRFGVASAELRLNLAEITGSSKSVTYQAWIEQNG